MAEDQTQAALIAEQLGRFKDQLNARMDRLEASLSHHAELGGEQARSIRSELGDMRDALKDHESRLRTVTDGVTTFKTWSGLASGGSSILAVVAFVKALVGG